MCVYDVISLTDPAASSISVLIFNGISEANTVFSIPIDVNRLHIYQNQLLNHSKAMSLNQTVSQFQLRRWRRVFDLFMPARLHPGLLRQPRAAAVNVTVVRYGAVRCLQHWAAAVNVSAQLRRYMRRGFCVYERAHGRDVSILSAFINYSKLRVS